MAGIRRADDEGTLFAGAKWNERSRFLFLQWDLCAGTWDFGPKEAPFMTVRIVGGNLRDLSYIAANLRPEDFAEVDCQLDGWTPASVALQALHAGPAYVAELDGNPEAAFGAGELRSGLWIAWSWGTRRMGRCVPRITKFVHDVLIPDIAARGGRRTEARALASNDMAVRWLLRLGATERCLLPAYGKNGEDFILFDWTRKP